ncbi:MAG: hypothetical protein AB8G18_17250 [Gammaproteobacteria bacterium]
MISEAVFADYFKYGIEVGIVEFAEAKEWAYSVIEKEAEPSVEVIDVAMSTGKAQIYDALGLVKGPWQPSLSGAWLFAAMHKMLERGDRPASSLAAMAHQIARSTSDENVCLEFDIIEDELELAKRGIYGTEQQCMATLETALEKHGIPFGSEI